MTRYTLSTASGLSITTDDTLAVALSVEKWLTDEIHPLGARRTATTLHELLIAGAVQAAGDLCNDHGLTFAWAPSMQRTVAL